MGRCGRKLTQTGKIGLAYARHLVVLPGTGDTIDPAIGDRVFRTTSSAELGEFDTARFALAAANAEWRWPEPHHITELGQDVTAISAAVRIRG